MNANFASLARDIEEIPVPEFNFARVQRCAAQKPLPGVRRRKIIASMVLIVAAPILAAAAVHFIPLDVRHRYGNWQLWGPSQDYTHPTAADFSRLAREAPYHVVWPVGMPRDHKLLFLGAVGSEVFTMAYACPGKNASYSSSSVVIIPKNYKAVNPKLAKWFESQMHSDRINVFWDVGDESVVVSSDCLTLKQIQGIREATIAAGRLQRGR